VTDWRKESVAERGGGERDGRRGRQSNHNTRTKMVVAGLGGMLARTSTHTTMGENTGKRKREGGETGRNTAKSSSCLTCISGPGWDAIGSEVHFACHVVCTHTMYTQATQG